MDDCGVEDGGDGYERLPNVAPPPPSPHAGGLPRSRGRGYVFYRPDEPYDPGRGARASRAGRGLKACMIDAVFLEKLQHHHLVIYLTYAPHEYNTSYSGLLLAIKEPYARRLAYCLSTVRFTWSDVKLLDTDTNGVACTHRASSLF
ncbi:hypothetical protein EDB85DRAFT_2157513 [Lactarius pseudohatsudake]|nr:hypothetical protein EDB85DRAFT_2157513 [Lactarius pseudohatsudake]